MFAVLSFVLILSFVCCHAGILKPNLEVSGLAAINETNMKEYVDKKISDGLENREGKHMHFVLF